MACPERIFLLLILVLTGAAAGAGSLEDTIWAEEDLGLRPPEERIPFLQAWAALDPEGEASEVILNRMFGIDDKGLDELIRQLGAADYYVRSRAAERILTYSAREVKKRLTQAGRRGKDPEMVFQVQRVLKELEENFYTYWHKGHKVRDNLLRLLSFRQDERFFGFAQRVYTQGSDAEKELILELSGHFAPERGISFLAGLVSHTQGAVLYSLFRQLRSSPQHPASLKTGADLQADRDLPVLLRANIAAVMPGGKSGPPGAHPDYPELLRRGRIKPVLKLAPDAPFPLTYLKQRPDRITTGDDRLLLGGVNAIDIRGDLHARVNGQTHVLPLYRIERLQMTPTGKRENTDFLARVVLKNNDALAGDVVRKDGDYFVVTCSYVRDPVRVPVAQIAYIQLNTEELAPARAVPNQLTSPVIRMDNGDALHGTITGCRGAFIGIRLRDFKIYHSPDRNGSMDLFLPRASVGRIDFPCPEVNSPRGFCRITTLLGDRLSGHLIEMNRCTLRLQVPELGVLNIDRTRIAELTFQSGFQTFKEHMLAAFAVTNSVQIFNGRGEVIWEKEDLMQPVHALRLRDGSILICERTGGKLSIHSRDKLPPREYSGFANIAAARELPNGNLLTCSYRHADSIVIIDRAGQTRRVFNSFPFASDAVMLADGSVAAISRRSNKLVIISPQDEEEASEYLVAPASLQLLPNGNLLVSSHKAIAEYDRQLRRRKVVTRFEAPKGFRHQRYTYAVDAGVFFKLDVNGNVILKRELDTPPDYITFY